MGSALAIPPASISTNKVTLIGSVLDEGIITAIQKNRHHPTLNATIPDTINVLQLADVNAELLLTADVIVLGVSSPGIDWACDLLNRYQAKPATLALVTKGLVQGSPIDAAPLTYVDALPARLTYQGSHIVGIGGPCIARELALNYPTRVTFAASKESVASDMRSLFQTDNYRISTHTNIVALEACAALKNFLCIGVSAMLTAYPLGETYAKNPLAALFNQAVRELFILSQWISESSGTPTAANREPTDHVAFDLAGMGDLHVTVGGGRNSRLGMHLGSGATLSNVLATSMAGVTVEGADTGRNLHYGFKSACISGVLDIEQLPLTNAILDCIIKDSVFAFDVKDLPG